MAVTAMSAGDVIIICQVGADPYCRGFFTNIEMKETGKLTALIKRSRGFLK
jgi:hypothetical protein